MDASAACQDRADPASSGSERDCLERRAVRQYGEPAARLPAGPGRCVDVGTGARRGSERGPPPVSGAGAGLRAPSRHPWRDGGLDLVVQSRTLRSAPRGPPVHRFLVRQRAAGSARPIHRHTVVPPHRQALRRTVTQIAFSRPLLQLPSSPVARNDARAYLGGAVVASAISPGDDVPLCPVTSPILGCGPECQILPATLPLRSTLRDPP